jgi:peptide/nickel transport system substrate-binding protein
MKKTPKILDGFRAGARGHEVNLLEGLMAGRIDRRAFLRHGSVIGLSAPTMASLLIATGQGLTPGLARSQTQGGTIRVSQPAPATAINPLVINSGPGIAIIHQTAEYLCVSGPDLRLRPTLATEWSPNADGTGWTFKLREGVKFHDGREMTADDVVTCMNRLADPDAGSNALSVFRGVMGKGGCVKVDSHTVRFDLEAAIGSFPYLVSSDNYNAIIYPADVAPEDYEKTFPGTGPFKFESYTPNVGATFVRNDAWWGGAAPLDRVEWKFFDSVAAQVLALQAGEVDVIKQLPVSDGIAILNDPAFTVQSIPSIAHFQVHMRTDSPEFQDKRVRQALALTLDREKIIAGLMKGKATIGNDSPFSPSYPMTDASVPQRKQDLGQAKQLLEAAGATGLKAPFTAERYLEIPQYAAVIQAMAKEGGIDLELNIMEQGPYYADGQFGSSPWLDSTMGATSYGHRGVPNVYLNAALKSDGPWNSARFKNPEFDRLTTAFVAALDLEAQKAEAGKIQRLLLDETPILFSFFYDHLCAVRAGIQNVQPSAMSHMFLGAASLS